MIVQLISFLTGWVAANAVGKVADTFFQVFCGSLIGIVLVATVAGVGQQSIGVTCSASGSTTVIEREAVSQVELRRRPCLGSVAACAFV